MCYERLLVLTNPCWLLPVGCPRFTEDKLKALLTYISKLVWARSCKISPWMARRAAICLDEVRQAISCQTCVSRTGIFHVLFALFFLTLTVTILQILSYQHHYTRFIPFCLLTSFTDNKKTHVLNSWCSRHNIYTTTVMDMVIFRTIFFELLVFFTFTLLTLHFAY